MDRKIKSFASELAHITSDVLKTTPVAIVAQIKEKCKQRALTGEWSSDILWSDWTISSLEIQQQIQTLLVKEGFQVMNIKLGTDGIVIGLSVSWKKNTNTKMKSFD